MKTILCKRKEFVSHFQNYAKHLKLPEWLEFITAFFESAPAQFLEDPQDKHLLRQVKRAWDTYQTQKELKLTIHSKFDKKRGVLCVEIFQKDQPFILETFKNALSHFHLAPKVIFHPVFRVRRSPDGAIIHIFSKEEHLKYPYTYESLISVDIPWDRSVNEAQSFIDDLRWRMELIHLAVDDWPKMRKLIQSSISEEQHSDFDYFDWLFQDNFLFFGLRTTEEIKEGKTLHFPIAQGSFGMFRDKRVSQNKNFSPTGFSPSENSLAFKISKTHYRSPVNRSARLDMIEFVGGKTQAYYQVIGLFTRRSYAVSNFKIPLIKEKVQKIFGRFGLRRNWHDGKMLMSALESIPHDEYWHFSEEEIYELCSRVLGFHATSLPTYIGQLSEDKSSLTLIVFVGRERYSIALKQQIGDYLAKHLGGVLTSMRGISDDSPFARLIYVVNTLKNSWHDQSLREEIENLSLSWEEKRHRLYLKNHRTEAYHAVFDDFYQKDFSPEQSLMDCELLERLDKSHGYAIKLRWGKEPFEQMFWSQIEIRLGSFDKPVVLSHLMDVLQNFGITINQEKTYILKGGKYYLHTCLGTMVQDSSFHKTDKTDKKVKIPDKTIKVLEDVILCTLQGEHPNDPFNALILAASFTQREVHLVRTYAEYMQQIKYAYGQNFIARALAEFPKIAALLLRFFQSRFDPKINDFDSDKEGLKNKEQRCQSFTQSFETLLKKVSSAEQDQLFRDMKTLIEATVRTNFYLGKSYVSLKFESGAIDRLPDPKPQFEVFVSSYLMQGIHLRSSKIARGGIRYSERPQDFRTEVLQLMQAQNLKNAIIVPTGAKGGFTLKKRCSSKDDVLEAYQIFLRGLLDITDNRIGDSIVHPPKLRIYDGYDPYLVVAADKGTASFSDRANALSEEYAFWLHDAFASGGSHGYDHKKLGITAKGAFVSVKHHLSKLGVDVERDPVTVVGIGDMSGDVFGNGMLLHNTFKLIAAFNHKHIFIDPHPHPQESFEERQRLFHRPSSSWDDYSMRVLSKGGAVYNRSEKALKLSSEAQKLFNLPSVVSPHHLIKALLTQPCDLLWFGGIGTYVKASDEVYSGDPSNDVLRVNAMDVRARVIGEGANLGITPLARIELGLKGVHLNSDAIDNVGGVNCSDREVNLKILLSSFSQQRRDDFFQEMSDAITHLILKDNQDQNEALDVMETKAHSHHRYYCDLIGKLEKEAGLKRQTVFLEKDAQLRQHRTHLTRPEFTILLAYSKLLLKRLILEHFEAFEEEALGAVKTYFPTIICDCLGAHIKNHLLYKELAALMMTNPLINHNGVLWLNEIVPHTLVRTVRNLLRRIIGGNG